MDYYLMLVVDAAGNVIWVYAGSGTSIKGMILRFITYDSIKDLGNNDVLNSADGKGHHLRTLLTKGYSIHIRPLLSAGHSEALAARVVSVEAKTPSLLGHCCFLEEIVHFYSHIIMALSTETDIETIHKESNDPNRRHHSFSLIKTSSTSTYLWHELP